MIMLNKFLDSLAEKGAFTFPFFRSQTVPSIHSKRIRLCVPCAVEKDQKDFSVQQKKGRDDERFDKRTRKRLKLAKLCFMT